MNLMFIWTRFSVERVGGKWRLCYVPPVPKACRQYVPVDLVGVARLFRGMEEPGGSSIDKQLST